MICIRKQITLDWFFFCKEIEYISNISLLKVNTFISPGIALIVIFSSVLNDSICFGSEEGSLAAMTIKSRYALTIPNNFYALIYLLP